MIWIHRSLWIAMALVAFIGGGLIEGYADVTHDRALISVIIDQPVAILSNINVKDSRI